MHDLNHHVLGGVENTDSWHAKKGDLQRAFPLEILMVLSSVIIVAADDEHLT
jgi:hypothetical protein